MNDTKTYSILTKDVTWLVLHNEISQLIVNVIFSVPIVVVDDDVIHRNGVNLSPVKFDTVLIIDNNRCQISGQW